jgi:nucleotide-binding universal stress UspA family protein
MNGTKIIKMKADVDRIGVSKKPHPKLNHLQHHHCASSIGKILVPIDFSLPSKRTLEYAAIFARQFGASITLLHVLKPTTCYADYGYGVVLRQFVGDNQIRKAKARLNAVSKQGLGTEIPATSIVRTGMPETEIVRVANELGVGLIIMTSRSGATSKCAARRGIAQTVVGTAACPVLVVRTKLETSSRRYRPNTNIKDSITLN